MVFDTLLSRTRLRKCMEDVNNLEAQVRLPGPPQLLAPTEWKGL
jgi:hypothetical protein